jgi:CheY-like chemotaxis protein
VCFRALLTLHTLFLMEKLVATKSSRQIPPIWTTEPNVQDSGITLAVNIWCTAFCEIPDMDALNCAPNGRILVVDDNARALRAMSELLEFEGFSVLTAKNGLDALNKMRAADHISLVLLDLWMPVMGGWEFLRRRKGDPDLANVPVVVISAIPPVDLDGSVLTKPIDLNQLMETVRHFV